MSDWSAQLCNGMRLSALEPAALAKARERFLERHPALQHEVQSWDDSTFRHKIRLLPGNVETATRRDAPGIRYQNPLLADAMYALGVIGAQGGGIRKMFAARALLPAPPTTTSTT